MTRRTESQEQERTPIVLSGRHGLRFMHRRQESYIFQDGADTLYVRLARAGAGNTLGTGEVATVFAVLFYGNERHPILFPATHAASLDQLMQSLLTRVRFSPQIDYDDAFDDQLALSVTTLSGGIGCIEMDWMYYIFEHPSDKHIVAATFREPYHLPHFDAKHCAQFSFLLNNQVRYGQDLHDTTLYAVQQRLLKQSFPNLMILAAMEEWFIRTLRKGARFTITLFQTIAGIAIWVNGIQLGWGIPALIALWVVSLLVAVDGTRRLCYPFERRSSERIHLSHHLRCLLFLVLGWGVLSYEVMVLRALPHMLTFSFAELWASTLSIWPLVVPPFVLSELALCIIFRKRWFKRTRLPL